jgi:hypothetical protein
MVRPTPSPGMATTIQLRSNDSVRPSLGERTGFTTEVGRIHRGGTEGAAGEGGVEV